MIVLDDGREYHLEERVAEMFRFVLDRMDRILETPVVKVEHNCAGQRLQSKMTIFESEAKVVK